MDFLGTMQNRALTFPPAVFALRAQYLNTCKDGQGIKETLTRKGEPKTPEQLGYAFAVVIAMLMDYCEEQGCGIFGCAPTKGMTKKILYKACSEEDDNGEMLTLGAMNKAEASAFIDRCMHWCAHLNPPLYIPPADPAWREKRNNGHTKSD